MRQPTPDILAGLSQGNDDALRLAMGPMDSSPLAPLSLVSMRLAEANTVAEVKSIIDVCDAARFYAKKANLNFELQNTAAEHALRARRKAGELLAQLEREPGQRSDLTSSNNGQGSEYRAVLDETGTTRQDANRWQKIAELPEDTFNGWLDKQWQAGQEITTTAVLRFAIAPHVAHNAGEHEWYTPKEYIDAARAVMGQIDLDPASTEIANTVVQASKFYTAEDNGLLYDWQGRVWMNPPYAQPLIAQFASRLREEWAAGRVSQAIVLVNNATETVWFQELVKCAAAVCFPLARVKFWSTDRIAAPLQGQAVLYLGQDVDQFIGSFGRFGWCAEVTR